MSKIPCLDLKGQHKQIKNEVFELFEKVYDNTAFSGGPFVEDFEKAFCTYTNTKYTIAVNNGTSALHLAMLALGIGDGDEVIIPVNSFIATAWGVSYVGATPVFVDCDANNWEIDPSKIENAITSKTKAIIGVHLYGMPFDIDAVFAIAKKHKLFLVEDAAQAQGARYNGKTVGGFGEMACFSFYPGKNLGACGEGGGITTNNENYYRHLQSLRNHGSVVRYFHDEIGFNMRMGGLEGASLSVKIKYIESWNNRRREIAKQYFECIKNTKILLPPFKIENSVFHLFPVRCASRDLFMEYLKNNGVSTSIHYPILSTTEHNLKNSSLSKLDGSQKFVNEILSIPCFPEMTDLQVGYVIDVINQF